MITCEECVRQAFRKEENGMEYRRAKLDDIESIMPIIRDAQSYLRAQGVDQWQDGFPDEAVIRGDIRDSYSYLFYKEGKPAGFVVLSCRPEKNYDTIYGGRWQTEGTNYAAIHRMAVSAEARGQGMSGKMFGLCERLARQKGMSGLRIDTHEENRVMRHLTEKYGFVYCGIIYLERSHAPRAAYEKPLTDPERLRISSDSFRNPGTDSL